MDEKKLGDRCPACGVKRQAFEPYQNPVSEARERWLSFDIHPVIVHFPQAFTFSSLLLLIALIPTTPFTDTIMAGARIMIIALPAVLFAAIASGIADGIVRFKKPTTPSLIKKIVLGSTAFAAASAMAALVITSDLSRFSLIAGLNAVVALCSVLLGLIGARLTCAKLPG